MTTTQGEHTHTELAHELFAAAQLAPGEGIEDAVSRIAAALTAAPAQPAAPQGVAYAELPKDVIRAVFIENGFTIKEGQSDLKQYVYDAAQALLRAAHGQAPTTQQPEGDVVAYLDVGANGYLDLGSDLSEDALQQLPKGRHALVIAGTYGIDGYVAAPQPSPTAQAASVPAVEREQERIAFKDAHRHLELDEVPDAWGRPMFKHSHVEASWLGWIARASHGQAPALAENGHLTQAGHDLLMEATLAGATLVSKGRFVGDMAQAAPAGADVRRSDLVPGVMHCAKCKFQLNRVTLCVSDGNAYAGDNKTEPCPNGCGPLWPVTWEQEARNCWKTLEEMHERLQAAPAADLQPNFTALRKALADRRFRGETDPQDLVNMAANVIAEDGDVLSGQRGVIDKLKAAPAAGAVAGKWPVGWSVSRAGDAWTVVAPDGQRRVWHEKTTSHDDSVFMWAFLEALNGPRPSPTDWAAVSNPAYEELPDSLICAVDQWFADNIKDSDGCTTQDVRELAEIFYGVTHEGGRESVDDALAIVESFGPGIGGINDTYARQVLLAEEVKRLREQAPNPERTGELLMGLAVIRELTGTQQKGLDETIDAVRAAVNDQRYQPAQVVPAVTDDLRDRLVAISAAVADQDDRAAQAMLREILKAPRAESQPAPVSTNYKQALGSTNCMQCCVSYMLGAPMESVPDFATGGGWERFSAFAESKGYATVMIPGNREFEADYLASGKTARGTSHMVVMNDGQLVHDPHPSNAGLTEVQCVWLLAKKATPQRDDREAFEACAKAYTSNVSFERDGDDYEDMTASLLWHGWKLRAARAPADSGAAPMTPSLTDDQIEKVYSLMNRRLFEGKRPCYAEVRAMLAAAPTPAAQADSAQDEPLQAFDSPRAKALMRAWEEGWAACRDAEYVGEEAQNDAFNSSHTLTLCIADDQQLPAPQADSVLEDAARLLRQILAASQDGDSDTHLSAHFVSRIETITKPGGAA